ncbi:hypothetical protein [Embleya scabrispora]|uniref:hypothetical protein n=1 Tax=Embleya scabrispora TaxID=159449 RepID=UPI0003623609|nr:hypothetical protein [Embleya scabrispora]MYS78768.1 hypothetical protein [Streptomyces sp. SID5474]
MLVGVVALGLVVALIVFLSTRSTSDRPRSYCWGLLPADELAALLPPGEYGEAAGKGALRYPAANSDGCMVYTKIRGRPQLAFRYVLDKDYRSTDQHYGIGGRLPISTPLGDGLLGMASDLDGWLRVPPCMADGETSFARVTAEDLRIPERNHPFSRLGLPGRAGNRERIAATMVALTNSARRKAGCTMPELPAPARRGEVVATAFAQGATLCGVPIAGVALGAHPTWVERWSGRDSGWEDCIVSDEAKPEEVSALRLEVRRGVLADLEYARAPTPETVGRVAESYVLDGKGSEYFARCSAGSVNYLLTIRAGVPLPASDAILRAVLAANAARDGCEPPA